MNRSFSKSKWYVSPFNDVRAVYQATKLSKIDIQDLTFLDWGKSYRMQYKVDEILQLLEKITEVGVSQFDIGSPSDNGINIADIKKICSENPNACFHMHVKASKEAIHAAADCGVSGIVLRPGYPKFPMDLGRTMERAAAAVSYAKECQLNITLAPFDIGQVKTGRF